MKRTKTAALLHADKRDEEGGGMKPVQNQNETNDQTLSEETKQTEDKEYADGQSRVNEECEKQKQCDAEKKKKRKRRLRTERLEKEVHGVLMALMCESGSDSVRVAAAKAILERINKEQEDDDDEEQEKQRERDEYLAEARGLLDALAALKSSRRSGKIAVA